MEGQEAAADPSQSRSHEARDWAALPRDVVLDILGRLRHADILGGAGLACAEWRRAAAGEPTLWRHIDLRFYKSDVVDRQTVLARLAMGRAAVVRSAGLCESFHGVTDPDLLVYLADRAPSLRSLVTLNWWLPEEYFDRVITRLPMLEWIELGYGHVTKATVLGLIKHCPRLELLDAGDCTANVIIEIPLRCRRKLTFIDLPWNLAPRRCFCLMCFPRIILPEEENIN